MNWKTKQPYIYGEKYNYNGEEIIMTISPFGIAFSPVNFDMSIKGMARKKFKYSFDIKYYVPTICYVKKIFLTYFGVIYFGDKAEHNYITIKR